MFDCQASNPERASNPPVAWVVPGPLRQVTGGYLYDARIVDGLRARGRQIGVVDIRSAGWPLDLAAGRRLVGALRRQRWGGAVIDELSHPAVAAAILDGRLRWVLAGAPLVLLVHHLRCSEPDAAPRRVLARLVERQVLQAADLVICTSATTAETVRCLTRSLTAVEVVRPGWDTHDALGRPAPSPRPAYHGAPVSPRPPLPFAGEGEPVGGLRVLLVGHWTPRKRIVDALRALRLSPASVTLDLVGETARDPRYAARVRAMLREPALAGRVRVHGRVASDVLAGLYASADALLLCSSHEGYGMVLAEALAAGLPIVATRVGAVPEVVHEGLEAELVEPGDIHGIARGLRRLACDPAERRRRAACARERAAGLPTWADSVAAFDDLLRGLR